MSGSHASHIPLSLVVCRRRSDSVGQLANHSNTAGCCVAHMDTHLMVCIKIIICAVHYMLNTAFYYGEQVVSIQLFLMMLCCWTPTIFACGCPQCVQQVSLAPTASCARQVLARQWLARQNRPATGAQAGPTRLEVQLRQQSACHVGPVSSPPAMGQRPAQVGCSLQC